MRLSKSSRRLSAISPDPYHRLQGNHLCDISDPSVDTEGNEENKPVSERTCLLFARAWDSRGFPISAGSNTAPVAIVKGGLRGEGEGLGIESGLYARVE